MSLCIQGWGEVGPHGRGPLGAQRDPIGGDPWERKPLGAQGIPLEGVPDPPWEGNPWEHIKPNKKINALIKNKGEVGWDPMGGDPWDPKGIP